METPIERYCCSPTVLYTEGKPAALISPRERLQECASVAKLESQLQSLCSELRKASAVHSSVKHVTLPALLGVESRLKHLVAHGSQSVSYQQSSDRSRTPKSLL